MRVAPARTVKEPSAWNAEGFFRALLALTIDWQQFQINLTDGSVQQPGGNLPRKIRELITDLIGAGFENRGGKGSHRKFVHPSVQKPVVISGKDGDDAQKYQERAVQRAIEESKK